MTDKTNWGPGPWQNEPDELAFTYNGHRCLILRNHSVGNLCGYVCIEPGEYGYGKSYSALDVSVHGGLTFGGYPKGWIDFPPLPESAGEPWVVGFDCAHLHDLCPGMDTNSFLPGIYRDLDYVKSELMQLVDQLITLDQNKENQ